MDPMMIYLILSSLATVATNIGLSQSQKNYDRQMIDEQNQYNAPDAQMQRLSDAGINPAGFGMGQGMSVVNQSARPNGYQLPNVVDPMTMASNSLLNMMSAQKAGEESVTERNSREVMIENIRKQGIKYDEEIAMLQLDQKAQQIANEYSGLLNEIAAYEGVSRINLNDAQTSHVTKLTEEAEYRLMNVLPEQVRLLVQQGKLNILEQDKVVAEIQRIYADTENISQDTLLKRQETVNSWYEGANLAIDADYKMRESQYLKYQIQMYLDTYDEQAQIVANEAKLSSREVKAFWIKTILGSLKDVGSAAGGVGVLVGGLGKFFPK